MTINKKQMNTHNMNKLYCTFTNQKFLFPAEIELLEWSQLFKSTVMRDKKPRMLCWKEI